MKRIELDMGNKLKRILQNDSLKYTLMSVIASGVNFITLIIFGRVFSVEDYGIITTLQAFLANVTVFMTPLQIMACEILAENSKSKENVWNSILSILIIINIIELFFLIIAANFVIDYLHFSGIFEYIFFVVLIFSNNSYTILCGVAQGKQDFTLLGKSGIILYAGKMILGILLGLIDLGVIAVIMGFLVAEVLCIIVITKRMFNQIKEIKDKRNLKVDFNVLQHYLWIFVLYIIVSLYMNNGDILLSNFYCKEEEIGLYSVAINLSKISVFLIATPMATLLLPRVSANKGNTKEQNRCLFIAESITLGVSAIYGICFYSLGNWIIQLLYGEAYKGSVAYILPCVFFSMVLSGFFVFYQYALVSDLLKIFTIVAAVLGCGVVVLILGMKISLSEIPVLMSGAMILTIVLSVGLATVCKKS